MTRKPLQFTCCLQVRFFYGGVAFLSVLTFSWNRSKQLEFVSCDNYDYLNDVCIESEVNGVVSCEK